MMKCSGGTAGYDGSFFQITKCQLRKKCCREHSFEKKSSVVNKHSRIVICDRVVWHTTKPCGTPFLPLSFEVACGLITFITFDLPHPSVEINDAGKPFHFQHERRHTVLCLLWRNLMPMFVNINANKCQKRLLL